MQTPEIVIQPGDRVLTGASEVIIIVVVWADMVTDTKGIPHQRLNLVHAPRPYSRVTCYGDSAIYQGTLSRKVSIQAVLTPKFSIGDLCVVKGLLEIHTINSVGHNKVRIGINWWYPQELLHVVRSGCTYVTFSGDTVVATEGTDRDNIYRQIKVKDMKKVFNIGDLATLEDESVVEIVELGVTFHLVKDAEGVTTPYKIDEISHAPELGTMVLFRNGNIQRCSSGDDQQEIMEVWYLKVNIGDNVSVDDTAYIVMNIEDKGVITTFGTVLSLSSITHTPPIGSKYIAYGDSSPQVVTADTDMTMIQIVLEVSSDRTYNTGDYIQVSSDKETPSDIRGAVLKIHNVHPDRLSWTFADTEAPPGRDSLPIRHVEHLIAGIGDHVIVNGVEVVMAENILLKDITAVVSKATNIINVGEYATTKLEKFPRMVKQVDPYNVHTLVGSKYGYNASDLTKVKFNSNNDDFRVIRDPGSVFISNSNGDSFAEHLKEVYRIEFNNLSSAINTDIPIGLTMTKAGSGKTITITHGNNVTPETAPRDVLNFINANLGW